MQFAIVAVLVLGAIAPVFGLPSQHHHHKGTSAAVSTGAVTNADGTVTVGGCICTNLGQGTVTSGAPICTASCPADDAICLNGVSCRVA